MANRRWFAVNEEQWGAFKAALDLPFACNRSVRATRSSRVPLYRSPGVNAGPDAIRKLEKSDDSSAFSSGAHDLDEWLKEFSWENQRANNATTYVSCVEGRVVGYYAITVGAVALTSTPSELKKRSLPDPLPCILLARLAVDRTVTGMGVGAGLLLNALERSLVLSESVGAAAVLIHARDEAAHAFYLANGNFVGSPIDDLQLLAPMKELRRALSQ